MDFHELEAFLALADTLHFARAASRVALSPSALSRLIFRLEEEAGVPLFVRDSRQVSITEDGAIFRDFAQESVFRRDDLQIKFSSKTDQPGGILRIYASVTACYSILPPFVEALSQEYPEVRLSIETGDPASAADTVREGRADLAVTALPPEGFDDLLCHSVKKTPLVFAASRSSQYGNLDLSAKTPKAYAKQLELVLSSVPLILPRTGLARQRFDHWVHQRRIGTSNRNFTPEITAETAGNEALLALARLGVGLALVPRLVLENSPFAEGLVLYPTDRDFGEYDIGFVQKLSESESSRKVLLDAVESLIRRTWPND